MAHYATSLAEVTHPPSPHLMVAHLTCVSLREILFWLRHRTAPGAAFYCNIIIALGDAIYCKGHQDNAGPFKERTLQFLNYLFTQLQGSHNLSICIFCDGETSYTHKRHTHTAQTHNISVKVHTKDCTTVNVISPLHKL